MGKLMRLLDFGRQRAAVGVCAERGTGGRDLTPTLTPTPTLTLTQTLTPTLTLTLTLTPTLTPDAPVLAHSDTRSLDGVSAFDGFLAVGGREEGFTQVRPPARARALTRTPNPSRKPNSNPHPGVGPAHR